MPSVDVSRSDAGSVSNEVEFLVNAVLEYLDLEEVFEEEEIKSYVRCEGPEAFWTREELLDILDIEEPE